MRVILILLVRQLIRMRYLKSESEAVQREVSLESQVIYVPLANRLGIGQIKWKWKMPRFVFCTPMRIRRLPKLSRNGA